jgi:hypothetical protein
MDKPRRVIASKCNYSFSLGLDQDTLRKLKELQDDPLFTLKGERQPSRTLIVRAAIQNFAHSVNQAKSGNKQVWLESQKELMGQLAFMGPKYQHFK